MNKIRRANLDDLPKLMALWELERLPAVELEKRFTEFQVVETDAGEILAALGLQISENQGKIHSEVFVPFDQAILLRSELWNRLLSVARNYGVLRVWVGDNLDFWEDKGFVTPAGDTLNKLPAAFGSATHTWRVMALKDESPAGLAIEKQFEIFRAEERVRLDALRARGNIAKWTAFVLLMTFALGFGGWMLYITLKGRARRGKLD